MVITFVNVNVARMVHEHETHLRATNDDRLKPAHSIRTTANLAEDWSLWDLSRAAWIEYFFLTFSSPCEM